MDIQTDPHEFSRDAWEANAEIWDERMGEEGNDFFNLLSGPPSFTPGYSTGSPLSGHRLRQRADIPTPGRWRAGHAFDSHPT